MADDEDALALAMTRKQQFQEIGDPFHGLGAVLILGLMIEEPTNPAGGGQA